MRIYFSGDNFFHLSLKLGPAPCGPAPAYPLLPIPSFSRPAPQANIKRKNAEVRE